MMQNNEMHIMFFKYLFLFAESYAKLEEDL